MALMCKLNNYRWSSPEKGENFIDSGLSTLEFMFEYIDPSLRGDVYSNMNSGVLELKLHEVHFADKFSGAEFVRRRRTCLLIEPSAVSTPMSTRRYPSIPMRSLRGEVYLAYLRVDIGMSRWKFSPFPGVLHMSKPAWYGMKLIDVAKPEIVY